VQGMALNGQTKPGQQVIGLDVATSSPRPGAGTGSPGPPRRCPWTEVSTGAPPG
jgi:hypothetical protein